MATTATISFGEIPREFRDPIDEFSAHFRAHPVKEPFAGTPEWTDLTQGVTSDELDTFDVYVVENRWSSLGDTALVDYRGAKAIEKPHFHLDPEVEVHHVLRGAGSIAYVGSRPQEVQEGDTLIMPSGLGHFWRPNGLILAVLNLPSIR